MLGKKRKIIIINSFIHSLINVFIIIFIYICKYFSFTILINIVKKHTLQPCRDMFLIVDMSLSLGWVPRKKNIPRYFTVYHGLYRGIPHY